MQSMQPSQLIDRLRERLRARLAPHLARWLPPAYVKSPVCLTFAYDVSDALIITMERILGICFDHGGTRTPALTPDDMAQLLGRSRTTMYRHLETLGNLKWIEWEQVSGRRIRIRPLIFAAEPEQGAELQPASRPAAATKGEPNPELVEALVAAGIEHPYRNRLAADPDLDAGQVRAWWLWTQHPDRDGLHTPTGVIIRRLEQHVPPPDEYLALARLTDEEMYELKHALWTAGRDLPEDLYRFYPLYREIFGSGRDKL